MAPFWTSDVASSFDQYGISVNGGQSSVSDHSTLLLIIFAGLVSISSLVVLVIACACCQKPASNREKEVRVPSIPSSTGEQGAKASTTAKTTKSMSVEPKGVEATKSIMNKKEEPKYGQNPAPGQGPNPMEPKKKNRYIEMDEECLDGDLFAKPKQPPSAKVNAEVANVLQNSMSMKATSEKQKLPPPPPLSPFKASSERKIAPIAKGDQRPPLPKADVVPATNRNYRTLAMTTDNFEPSIVKKPPPKQATNPSFAAPEDVRYQSFAGIDDVFAPTLKGKSSKSDA